MAPHAAQERHQQGGLGVALTMAVPQHVAGRDVIRPVVAKGNVVAHEIVDGANPIGLRQT